VRRADDLNALFDAIRDKNDASYSQAGTGVPLSELLAWMRTLHSLTLREYRKAMDSTNLKHSTVAGWGHTWGDSVDLLLQAGAKRLDDTTTALLLFTSDAVEPMMGGSAAASRFGGVAAAIYEEANEYMSGLYDTLRYHREISSEGFVSALFGPNIYNASLDARESITALLTVTDRIINASLREFCRTPNQHDPEPPHERFHGFSDSSLWLRNGELVQYILDHPKDATLIAHVIVERTTDNLATITGVLEHEVSAFSSGSL
jgi:hypothetical protein